MKKYYSHSILLLEGFILGFFEMIPFLRIDFVRNLFHIKLSLKDDFQKVIKRNWSYYLGVFLGIIFFFAIPLSFMMENYSGTIKVNRGNFYRVAVSAFIEDDKD